MAVFDHNVFDVFYHILCAHISEVHIAIGEFYDLSVCMCKMLFILDGFDIEHNIGLYMDTRLSVMGIDNGKCVGIYAYLFGKELMIIEDNLYKGK